MNLLLKVKDQDDKIVTIDAIIDTDEIWEIDSDQGILSMKSNYSPSLSNDNYVILDENEVLWISNTESAIVIQRFVKQ